MNEHIIVVSAAATLVIACVLIHYEVLQLLAAFMRRLNRLHRTRIVLLIFGLLFVHLIQVSVFAVGYYNFRSMPELGHVGEGNLFFLDYVYFSFVTFTTLGYGDLVPFGPIRLIAAVEALSGLVLLTWSGSFTFIEMQRFWKDV